MQKKRECLFCLDYEEAGSKLLRNFGNNLVIITESYHRRPQYPTCLPISPLFFTSLSGMWCKNRCIQSPHAFRGG